MSSACFLISLGEDPAYSFHGEDRNGSEKWISIKEGCIRWIYFGNLFLSVLALLKWNLPGLILFIISLSDFK